MIDIDTKGMKKFEERKINIKTREREIISVLSKVTFDHIGEMSILLMNNHFLSCIHDFNLLEDLGKVQKQLTLTLQHINVLRDKLNCIIPKRIKELEEVLRE